MFQLYNPTINKIFDPSGNKSSILGFVYVKLFVPLQDFPDIVLIQADYEFLSTYHVMNILIHNRLGKIQGSNHPNFY